jgi:hypothetical protein
MGRPTRQYLLCIRVGASTPLLGACLDIQAIANTRFRQDIARVRWVRFELASQHSYCHSQIRHSVHAALAPYGAQDLLVRNHLAGTFSKNPQHVVRLR